MKTHDAPTLRLRPLLAGLVAAAILVSAVAVPAEAARFTRKQQINADRELVGIMQVRDRGEVVEAINQVVQLIERHPEFIPAHRLYQEMAVISRRNGGFVEAEYRHLLEAEPDDPRRNLLHASASLSAVVAKPETLTQEVLRDIERKIALAEGDPRYRSQARILSADIARWAGDSTRFESQLRASLKAEKGSLTARSDLTVYLALKKEWSEATDLCIKLIQDAPWRVIACAPLVPLKAGAAGPEQEDQDRLIKKVERIGTKNSRDPITLQSLERFYDSVGERRGAEELRAKLLEMDPKWTPPLDRNPYIEPLPGGELSRESLSFIETIGAVRKATASDPAQRVRRYRELASSLPDDPRMQAYYHRELAFTLRNPEILDREASRQAIRRAHEVSPTDPSVMNELAYMSAVDKVDLEEALVLVDKAIALLLNKPFEPLSIGLGEEFADFEIGLSESVGAFVDTRGWVLYQMGRHQEAVQELELASLMTRDGTVQSHLGRARYQRGNRRGAFHHLVRALALGTEDEEEVRSLAEELYAELHVVPGGLDSLVKKLRQQLIESGLRVLEGTN